MGIHPQRHARSGIQNDTARRLKDLDGNDIHDIDTAPQVDNSPLL
jgi:hypothetical protein